MFKQTLGILGASVLFVVGCGDKAAPTQPVVASPSYVPVVTSAEPTQYYFGAGWILHGSYLYSASNVTLESGNSTIRMNLEESTPAGSFIGVSLPEGAPPGAYTPCVRTLWGKGCGGFLVTVE